MGSGSDRDEFPPPLTHWDGKIFIFARKGRLEAHKKLFSQMYSTLEPIDEREQAFLRSIEPGTPFQLQKTSKQKKEKSHVVDDAEDEVEHEDEGRHDKAGFAHMQHNQTGGPWAFTSPQRRAFVHEIADEVMMRIGEVLPHYNEFMQREANFNVSLIFNKNTEEIIPTEDLLGLSVYVVGDLPKWGDPKPWWNYNKMVMICHLPGHWGYLSNQL